MSMTSGEIRKKFLEFFEKRGHIIIPSASLVPENDPTTLFTGSGMQPLIPYLLGEPHPMGKRLANSEKCFRAEDIEAVGDNRHTTFFEMLGNWSLGDYWKEAQLPWFFEFLTKEIGIPKEKLWVTCFAGDEGFGLPKDSESAGIWVKLGIPERRIRFYGAEKNWWSRSGEPKNMPAGEPGGPDSEVFYEFTQVAHDKQFGESCHPNCDCGRFLEIGNSVFMEYKKRDPSTSSGQAAFEKLAQRNVDFGGGLERITAAANDNPDVFGIDVFKPIMKYMPEILPVERKRIIADHARASTFLLSDGVRPSNKETGYILRRLLRRVFIYMHIHSLRPDVLEEVMKLVILEYGNSYPELGAGRNEILNAMWGERERFQKTLVRGMREFEKISAEFLPGKVVFDLHQTYGFPLELVEELARERNIGVDKKGFEEELRKHQVLSRTSSAGMFKGGLADESENTIRLHTAHHLLLKALQVVLGPAVKQRGSNITSERLRLDFLYGEKLADKQKKEVESIVNEKIAEDLPVVRSEMAREEAERLGAEHEFGQKYPERVSVYSIGPKGATQGNQKFGEAFSIEFCGGPHVGRTGEIGNFRIAKEEAVSAGIRRIRGVLAE